MTTLSRRKPRAIFTSVILLSCTSLLAATAHASAVNWLESPLAGPDKDRDNVRDDVGKLVQAAYSHTSQRHWAMEVARATQRYVTSDDNPFAIYRAKSEMQRAMNCLVKISDDAHAGTVRDTVIAWVLNNDNRRSAYERAVASWENDVSKSSLPKRPDDRWKEGCTPFDKSLPASARATAKAKPAKKAAPAVITQEIVPSIEKVGVLPPPNFFLTGEVPKQPEKKQQPQKAVEPASKPDLPDALIVDQETLEKSQQVPEWAQVKLPGEAPANQPVEKPVQQPAAPAKTAAPEVPTLDVSDIVDTLEAEIDKPAKQEAPKGLQASDPIVPTLAVPAPETKVTVEAEAVVDVASPGLAPATDSPAIPTVSVEAPAESEVVASPAVEEVRKVTEEEYVTGKPAEAVIEDKVQELAEKAKAVKAAKAAEVEPVAEEDVLPIDAEPPPRVIEEEEPVAVQPAPAPVKPVAIVPEKNPVRQESRDKALREVGLPPSKAPATRPESAPKPAPQPVKKAEPQPAPPVEDDGQIYSVGEEDEQPTQTAPQQDKTPAESAAEVKEKAPLPEELRDLEPFIKDYGYSKK